MEAVVSHSLGEKGRRLLALLVDEIARGRFKKRQPPTFISYGEALDKLHIPRRGRAGQQLQREGLTELNEWTKQSPELPKIAGLIIDKRWRRPAIGYPKSHGRAVSDWEEWWLTETDKAIDFDWAPFVEDNYSAQRAERVREEELRSGALKKQNIDRITFDPAVMGGRPCIRGMRVTVGTILGLLAAGHSKAKVLKLYPYLETEDIDAALAFAAWRSEEREMPLRPA